MPGFKKYKRRNVTDRGGQRTEEELGKEVRSRNKSNPNVSPNFDGLRQPPSSFEDVFRHFEMNL